MSVQLTIKVTKNILQRSALCGSSEENQVGHNCAIALAARDIFPNAFVSSEAIHPFGRITDNNDISLPEEARLFIERFDVFSTQSRMAMPELEFVVEIPDHIIKQINISEITELLKNHSTLSLNTIS